MLGIKGEGEVEDMLEGGAGETNLIPIPNDSRPVYEYSSLSVFSSCLSPAVAKRLLVS